MGNCSSLQKQGKIRNSLLSKLIVIWELMDSTGKGYLKANDDCSFWQVPFQKINQVAMLNSVDFKKIGRVTVQDWLQYWGIVLKIGYSQDEVEEELDNIIQNRIWRSFSKADQYLRNLAYQNKDILRKYSTRFVRSTSNCITNQQDEESE